MEGIDPRFWNEFHMDFYTSVVRNKKNKALITAMKYVDWPYYEKDNDEAFKEAIDMCKEFGLYELMGFKYHWNAEILG